MKQLVPISISLVLAGVLVWVLWVWEPPAAVDGGHAPGLSRPAAGGDFVLHSARGPLSSRELRGRVLLIYFGYTHCPDVCPTNLAFIANALKALSEAERARVQALFVTLDPERDTPRRLAEYTAWFHPDLIGLTGAPGEIAAAAAAYGVAWRRSDQPDSSLGYAIDHSSESFVVDTEGRLAHTLGHATSADRIAALVRGLLGSSG